jgi:hypothetical protein
MAPTDHNKVLGILHLAYGGFSVFLMAAISVFMLGVFGVLAINQPRGEAVPLGVFAVVMIFVVLINLIIIAPSFLAGYALLKRKTWAKTMGIIAGIIAGMSFPIGTAVCVYTLWFLLGEKGRALYDRAAYALPPAPPFWATASRKQEPQYVPPSSPPDWR